MRPTHVEILDETFDDDALLTPEELGLSVDVAREKHENDDDLGFRTLLENPETILRSLMKPRAA